MSGELVGLVSMIVSLAAVAVAVWTTQRSRALSVSNNSLQLVADVFREYRSPEFRAHANRVYHDTPDGQLPRGFESLPVEYRRSAYTVCYFFDHIGVLVAFDLVRKDVIIGPMCTQIIRTWHTLEASIAAERAHRARTYPADASPGFLNYFEHLVAVVHAAGGRNASVRINRRIGLRRLTGPASGQ